MNKKNIQKELLKLAAKLDAAGLYKEASKLDAAAETINKFALGQYDDPLDDPNFGKMPKAPTVTPANSPYSFDEKLESEPFKATPETVTFHEEDIVSVDPKKEVIKKIQNAMENSRRTLRRLEALFKGALPDDITPTDANLLNIEIKTDGILGPKSNSFIKDVLKLERNRDFNSLNGLLKAVQNKYENLQAIYAVQNAKPENNRPAAPPLSIAAPFAPNKALTSSGKTLPK